MQRGHVMFWIGSALSTPAPSSCPGTASFRDAVARALSPNDETPDECVRRATCAARELPFEEVMQCVSRAMGAAIFPVLDAAFRSRPPNAGHERLAAIIARLLADGATRVTVVTTNYDECIETALEQALEQERQPWTRASRANATRFPVYAFSGGRVMVAKPHGTIGDPGSLVFATNDWTRFLVDEASLLTEFEALGVPDRIIALGYGFLDPDLRPAFAHLLHRGSRLLRLEKPEPAPLEDGMPDATPSSQDDPVNGAEILRDEFFQAVRLSYEATRVDLYTVDAFRQVAAYLASVGFEVAGWEPTSAPGAQPAVDPPPAVRLDLSTEQAESLTISLVLSAASGSAADLSRRRLERAVDLGDPAGTRLSLEQHLLSLGHNGNYDEAAKCAARFAADPDPDISLIAASYGSFALSLAPGPKWRALLPLAQSLLVLFSAPDALQESTRNFFAHRALHFVVKALELGQQRRFRGGYPKAIIRYFHSKLAGSLANLMRGGDLYEYAEIEDLRAQLLILSSLRAPADAARALAVARRVRVMYYSIGQRNSIAMAERTYGWACHAVARASVARQEYLQAAAAAFERGVQHSDGVDPTVRPKLQANLLRVQRQRGVDCRELEDELKRVYGARALEVALGDDRDFWELPIFLAPDPTVERTTWANNGGEAALSAKRLLR
jgi:hypothetical protein